MKVKIESVAFKGYGVGRLHGKVIFVPYTVTGDEVSVTPVEERKDFSIAKLKGIITPSPWRVTPPCPYFGYCGGCQWQHIEPMVQGELKKEILKNLFQRLGRLKELPPLSLIPSSSPYGYRARIQLKVDGKRIGFFEGKSHRIIEIDQCLIAHPLVNSLLKELQKGRYALSHIREIEINVSPEEEKGILIFHLDKPVSRETLPIHELIGSSPFLKGWVLAGINGWEYFGDPILYLKTEGISSKIRKVFRLRVSPESFYQVNLEQNLTLLETVLEFAQLRGEERVLELYSGIGNFSLPLAMKAGWILGIEENRKAIEDARFNAEENRIGNCQFLLGRVEERMKELGEGVDLMVLDPPRRGAKSVLVEIERLRPKRIIYLSCDPTTFIRDITLLLQKGYSLQKVRLVDMFPQSYHMEVIGLLEG